MKLTRLRIDKDISQVPRNVNVALREKLKLAALQGNDGISYTIDSSEFIYGPIFYEGKTYYTWTSSTHGSIWNFYGIEIDKKYPQRR